MWNSNGLIFVQCNNTFKCCFGCFSAFSKLWLFSIKDISVSVDYLITQRAAEKDGKAVVELSFKTYDYLTLAADTAVRLTKEIALSGKKPDSDEFRDMFIALFREKINKADATIDVVLNMYMEKEKDGWKITKVEDSNGNITKMYNSIYSMYKMAQ